MARLPKPGGDDGNWGQILNDYLSQTHTADGKLKDGVVTSNKIAPNAINATALGVSGGSDGQILAKDSTKSSGLAWQTISGGGQGVSDATTSTKGVVQLAGDLGGTASAPTVPGLANKQNTIAAGTTAQYYRGDKTWQTLNKNAVGLTEVDNTADADKPVSSAVQTALNSKATDANVVHLAGTETISGTKTFSTSPVVPTPTAGTQAANKSYVDNQIASGTAPDATSSSKGIVQLAGDLGGTAAAPTVPGLASKQNTIAAGTTAQYYRGDKTWQTLDKQAVGLANVDNTSDANKPVSTAMQTALNDKLDTSQKGSANGVATLDSSSKVTTSQLTGVAALATLGGSETVSSLTSTSSTTLNLANANVFNVTLGVATTAFTFSGATNGRACSFSLYVRQSAGGNNAITWPAGTLWAGGAPAVTTTANAIDVFVFESINGGTTWFGSLVGNDFKT